MCVCVCVFTYLGRQTGHLTIVAAAERGACGVLSRHGDAGPELVQRDVKVTVSDTCLFEYEY